eukprot:gene1227-747_t
MESQSHYFCYGADAPAEAKSRTYKKMNRQDTSEIEESVSSYCSGNKKSRRARPSFPKLSLHDIRLAPVDENIESPVSKESSLSCTIGDMWSDPPRASGRWQPRSTASAPEEDNVARRSGWGDTVKSVFGLNRSIEGVDPEPLLGQRRSSSRSGKELWAIARDKVWNSVRKKEDTAHIWAGAIKALREKMELETRRKVNQFRQFEGLDYTDVDNQWRRDNFRHLQETDYHREKLMQFGFSIAIGCISGFLAWGIITLSGKIHEHKNQVVLYLGDGDNLKTVALFTLLNVFLMAKAAWFVIWYQPVASGAGIAEVKTYLNGCMIRDAFSRRTFVAKVLSCIASCSVGLPVGPEGPIIHLGGCIGAALADTKVFELLFPRGFCQNKMLFKRSCVTVGVASGVSAAFGAPVGALLFTSEEVASFWSANLLWQTFVASAIAYGMSVQLRGGVGTTALFDVGHSFSQQEGTRFAMVQCILLGIVCGVMGSLFSNMNVYVNQKWRKAYINVSRNRKFLEVIAITITCTSLFFLYPYIFSSCQTERGHSSSEVTWFDSWACPHPSKQHNPLANLVFLPLEEQVKVLFAMHNNDFGDNFSSFGSCLAFFIFFTGFALFIAGSHISTGLFIPIIVAGASMGRAFGFLDLMIRGAEAASDPGIWAMLGASGFLAGVTHMCVATTVIMLEITYDFSFLLPIVTTIAVAKFTAENITFPLYEMLIEVKHIPFMDAEPSLMMQKLRVEHIMQRRRLIMLRRHITVGEVVALLADPDVSHNAFPVVKGDAVDIVEHQEHTNGERLIVGLVLRSHLKFFIKHKLFLFDSEEDMFQRFSGASENESYEEHCGDNPLHIDEQYYEYLIDLSRFMSRSPPTISPCATVTRAFHMFRALGLRHLVVINTNSEVVGMITRHDLVDVQIHPHKYAHAANFKYFKQMELYNQWKTTSSSRWKKATNVVKAVQEMSAQRARAAEMVQAETQSKLLPVEVSRRSRRLSYLGDDENAGTIDFPGVGPAVEDNSDSEAEDAARVLFGRVVGWGKNNYFPVVSHPSRSSDASIGAILISDCFAGSQLRPMCSVSTFTSPGNQMNLWLDNLSAK